MDKYEYKSENKYSLTASDLGDPLEKLYLNMMGNEGWELCAVTSPSFGNSYVYYWKRKLPEPPKP